METTYRPMGTVLLIGHWGVLLTEVPLAILLLPKIGFEDLFRNVPDSFWFFLGLFAIVALSWSFLIHFRIGIQVGRRSIRFVMEGRDFGEPAARVKRMPLGILFNIRERVIDFDSLQAYGFRIPASGVRGMNPLADFFFLREKSGTEWTFDLHSFSGSQRDDLLATLGRNLGFACEPASTRKPTGKIYSPVRDFWTRFPVVWFLFVLDFFIFIHVIQNFRGLPEDPSASSLIHSFLPLLGFLGGGLALLGLIILSDLAGGTKNLSVWKRVGIGLLAVAAIAWIASGLSLFGLI